MLRNRLESPFRFSALLVVAVFLAGSVIAAPLDKQGRVSGLDVQIIAGKGTIECSAFIGTNAQDEIQVFTTSSDLQGALETATATHSSVEVSYVTVANRKKLVRVRLLDRSPTH